MSAPFGVGVLFLVSEVREKLVVVEMPCQCVAHPAQGVVYLARPHRLCKARSDESVEGFTNLELNHPGVCYYRS